jgi:hypothetical protein
MKKSVVIAVSLAVLGLAVAGNAAAAVTCEQLAEIAYVTERMRDNGTPLAEVMLEADRLEAGKRFTALEIADIRDTIDNAFKRIRNTNETLLECRAKTKK